MSEHALPAQAPEMCAPDTPSGLPVVAALLLSAVFEKAGDKDISIEKHRDQYGRCNGGCEKPGCCRRVHQGKYKGAYIQ